MKTRTLILLSLLVCLTGLASAQTSEPVTLRFEQCPSVSNVACTQDVATFTGGYATITNDPYCATQKRIYWSAADSVCLGCNPIIKVAFATEVSDVKFSVNNGWPHGVQRVLAWSDNGSESAVFIPPFSAYYSPDPHWRQMVMPGGSFREITVSGMVFNGCLTFNGPCYNNYWNYALDDFIYTKTPIDTRIVFGTRGIPGMGDPLVKTLPRTSQVSANYPLGATFFARLERKQGESWVPILTSAELSNATVTDKNTLETTALFPAHPVIAYNQNAREKEKIFQGIHYGTALITLVSNDPKFPRVTMKVTINAPARLGQGQYVDDRGATQNVNYDYDSIINLRAHRTGIPPQWIKAQIEQEANFNPTAYRYELRTRDWQMVQDASHPYHHSGSPFVNYRMGDGAQLCNPAKVPGVPTGGCRFSDLDDISPRGRYRILDPVTQQPRNIVAADGVVTIRQIVDADNGRYGWFPPSPTPVVPKPGGRRRAVRHPDPLNVPAQTTIASSYGLLQLVYTDMIDRPMRWQGIDGRYNPTLFFDTKKNHDRGGGSLVIGSRLATLKWGRTNPDPVNPSYAAPANFAADLRDMYIEYNGRAGYGAEVEARIEHYTPIPSTAISAPACTEQRFKAQSHDAKIAPGDGAILGVAIDADDVEYQWFSGSQTNAVPGATTQSLAVSAPGTYWCRAKTGCGFVWSDPIVVSTAPSCTAPAIRIQPQTPKTLLEGMTTSFGVEATGTGLRYQWYKGEPTAPASAIGAFNPPQAIPLVGENAPTITVQPNVTTTYFLYVENSCGAAISDVVTVVVEPCTPVKVTGQSAPTTITRGESTVLSIALEGTASFAIQWYSGTPDAPSAVEGATGSELTVTPQVTTTYFATITNRCGTASSVPVLITVDEPCVAPSISAQSAATTITRGESTTVSITPAGSEPRSIQWYAGASPITGANVATYEVTPNETTTYHAVLANACGEVSSAPVTITVTDACSPASIGSQSSSKTITRGESTTLSITPGGSTPRTIQWYAGAAAIAGANGASYEASPSATTTYRAVLTNECGEAASAPIVITVVEPCVPASISAQSSSVTIVLGESTTLSIAAAGSTPRTIQWYTGTPGQGSSLPVNGANAGTLAVAPTATVSYFAIVTNDCGSATSTPVSVTVTAACVSPAVTAQSESTSIVRGDSTTLSVTASGTAPRTTQWYTGTPANASYIPGATGTSLTVSPTSTTSYFAIISNACGAANSTPVTITVTDACVAASITSQSTSRSISSGQSTTLSISVAGSTPRTIQWFVDGVLINGATSATLVVSPQETTTYVARVSNACGSDESAPIVVTVDCIRPSITSQPQSQSIEEGEAVTLSVTASNASGYQWYSNFTPIPGATSRTLTESPSSTRQYFVRVTNDCGSTDSATVTVTVNPPSCDYIQITQQPANRAITAAESATLTVVVAGTSPQYQWEQNINGLWTKLTGKTASSLTVTPPAGTHSYRVAITNACSYVTSNVATVTVGEPCTPPAVTQQPVDPTFTSASQSATISVGATGSNLQYEWFRNGASWSTSASILVSPSTTVTQQFYCVVSNACGSERSITITIEPVCEDAQVTIVSVSDPVVPPGGSSVLHVNSYGQPLLRWKLYERPVGGSAYVISSGTAMYVPNATVVPPATSDYWYEVTNDCGTTTSNVVRITVQ